MRKYIQSSGSLAMLFAFVGFVILSIIVRFMPIDLTTVMIVSSLMATLLVTNIGNDFDFIGSTNPSIEGYFKSLFIENLYFTLICLISAFLIGLSKISTNLFIFALIFLSAVPAISLISIVFKLRKYLSFAVFLIGLGVSILLTYIIIPTSLVSILIARYEIRNVGDLT